MESFSKIHILLNLLQAFFVFISITIWLFLGENCRSVNKSIFVILLIAISVATFHSLTLIDYDWRYRFPLIIPLLIILPISIEIILRKIVDKNF